MKTGFNQATSMHCSTLEKDVQLCEAQGFDFIEFRLDKLKEYFAKNSIDDLKALLAGKRIKPHAFNALYTWDELFLEPDSIKDAQLLDDFKWGLEIAKEIGSQDFIIVPPLQRDPNGGPYNGTEQQTHENCVRILNKLGAIAEAYHVRLCFEIVGFNRSSVRSVEQAWKIIQEVNRENVGLVLDAYNLYLYEQLNDFSVIKQIDSKKIFCVHINNCDDTDGAPATQEKRCFCDAGIININNFLQNLKEVGYDGIISVEIFRPEYWQKPAEWVISSAWKTTKKVMEINRI